MKRGVADKEPETERDKVKSWTIAAKRERMFRREEVVVNKLPAGLCLLTHEYLMENSGPQIPLICGFYNDAILTVKHLLVEL